MLAHILPCHMEAQILQYLLFLGSSLPMFWMGVKATGMRFAGFLEYARAVVRHVW